MCGRKKRYSRVEAMRIAREINRVQVRPVHAYECPFGRHWHVGGVAYKDKNRFQNERR